MPQLIAQLVSCPKIFRAEDKDMFCCLSSPAAAAEGERHRGDPGLKQKRVQAIYSRFQLDGQRALRLQEPFM